MLSLLWIGAFACYIAGLTNPLWGMTAMLLFTLSPFYVAHQLRKFRDYARDGVISFRRGYAYTILTFFYAGVLLALAIYVYFAFIDKGYLTGTLMQFIGSKEGQQVIKMYGMADQMQEGLKALSEMRPIDYAVNMLTVNITTGLLLGIPIAAVAKRLKVKSEE